MNSTKDPEASIAMIYKYISLTVRYRNNLNGYEVNSFIVVRQSRLNTCFFVRLHQQQITMPQVTSNFKAGQNEDLKDLQRYILTTEYILLTYHRHESREMSGSTLKLSFRAFIHH
jgi:hypothetical protein